MILSNALQHYKTFTCMCLLLMVIFHLEFNLFFHTDYLFGAEITTFQGEKNPQLIITAVSITPSSYSDIPCFKPADCNKNTQCWQIYTFSLFSPGHKSSDNHQAFHLQKVFSKEETKHKPTTFCPFPLFLQYICAKLH